MKNYKTVVSGVALVSCLVLVSAGGGRLVRAGDAPPKDASAKIDTCQATAGAYAHGALGYFNSMLCLVNVQYPGLAEEALYHLVVDMGLSPSVDSLAAAGTTTALDAKTFGGKAITGTIQKVVSPDTFAGTYDYKATISVNAAQHIALYWSGKGTSSKGFMIMGGTSLGTGANHLQYIRWDRTTAAQVVDVLATTIQAGSTYLATVQPAGSGKFGDRAMYASATYNTATKDTRVQMTTIGARRGAQAASTTPGCFMMTGSGIKGGNVVVAKTNDALAATGHPVSDTTQDGIVSMDSASVVDSATTANGTGNSASAPAFAMFYSCSDLNGAAGASKPFLGNAVNFAMTKTQADAMFNAN